MKQRATIYDIASYLNITASTVSRALNNQKQISEKTKAQVLKAARKLNYRHNANASNLRTGGSKTIGVIVPQVTIDFFANAIAGIEEVASRNGYNIIICQSDDDHEKEKKSVETLIKNNVACIILSLASGTSDTAHLRDALKSRIPVVQFDRTDQELATDRVVNDMDVMVSDLVRHIASQGYKKIGYLEGPQHINIFKKRTELFKKCLKNQRLPFIKKYVRNYDLTRQSAYNAAMDLLGKADRPDAILAVSDYGALGVWQAAKALGLQVPGQLGISGFSNELYTALVTPSITTVDQFSLELGTAACTLFLESRHLPAKRKPQTIVIKPALLVRESTLKSAPGPKQ